MLSSIPVNPPGKPDSPPHPVSPTRHTIRNSDEAAQADHSEKTEEEKVTTNDECPKTGGNEASLITKYKHKEIQQENTQVPHTSMVSWISTLRPKLLGFGTQFFAASLCAIVAINFVGNAVGNYFNSYIIAV